MAVSAKITETGDVDSRFGTDLGRNAREAAGDTRPDAQSNQVYAVNAVGYINYDVGTAQTLVGDGGAVILQNPALIGAEGRKILVVVSPRIVPQSAAVLEPNTHATSVGAPPSVSNSLRQAVDARRTPSSDSPESQSTNTPTRSEGQATTKKFASAIGTEAIVQGVEIQYDFQPGICVVTNGFVLRFGGAVLTARQGRVNFKTGEVIAEGEVTLQRGDQVLRAERFHYNYIDQKVTDAVSSNSVPVLGDVPLLEPLFRSEATSQTQERKATHARLNPESGKDSGADPDLSVWLRTYVCAGFRLELNRNGMYRISLEEGGVRRTETGKWKRKGREFLLERTAGDLQYAIRRLRADERNPSHLLWVLELSDPFGAIDSFVFKPVDETAVVSSRSEQTKLKASSVLETNPAERLGKAPSSNVAPSNSVPVLGDLPFVGRLFRTDTGADSPARQAIQSGPNPEPRIDSGVESASKAGDESPAALVNRVFQFDPRTFYEDVHRYLVETGWSDIEIYGHSNEWKTSLLQKFCESLGLSRLPPNAFFYSDSGMLMVRATADKLDRVQQAIETLNALRPKDALSKLETRVFRVDPRTFLEPLRAPLKSGTIEAKMDELVSSMRDPQVKTSTAQQTVRDFFTATGVNVQPPNMVFFNDRTSMLMVRATAKEMDLVQKALETLNYRPPPQITLEARFIEMATETGDQLGLDLPPPDAASETWTRILTAARARTVLRKAERLQGVTLLSAPKVTTLSGRQCQIQVSDVNNIAKSRADGLPSPGLQSNANVTAQPELTSEVQPSMTLDVLPLVGADGYTIQLSALSQAAELLRYDNTPDGVIMTGLKAAGRNREARLPLTVIRALILLTRRMQAAIDVYDGQTLVLGKPKVTFTSQQPDGEPVSFAVPEDTGKRLLVFITPTIIDPAGNPIHASGKEPWIDKTPPQPR